MAVAHSTKYIGIKYDVGYGDTSTSLTRTYTDVIDDATKVAVSYNGQRILKRTAENVSVANNYFKYYYELTITGSDFTIVVKANPNYLPIGFDAGILPTAITIHPDDLFFVEYTYTFTI